jgi:hypothetical protein
MQSANLPLENSRKFYQDCYCSREQRIVFYSYIIANNHSKDLLHSPAARSVNFVLVINSYHYMVVE